MPLLGGLRASYTGNWFNIGVGGSDERKESVAERGIVQADATSAEARDAYGVARHRVVGRDCRDLVLRAARNPSFVGWLHY